MAENLLIVAKVVFVVVVIVGVLMCMGRCGRPYPKYKHNPNGAHLVREAKEKGDAVKNEKEFDNNSYGLLRKKGGNEKY